MRQIRESVRKNNSEAFILLHRSLTGCPWYHITSFTFDFYPNPKYPDICPWATMDMVPILMTVQRPVHN